MGWEQDGGDHKGISFMKSSPVLVEIKILVSPPVLNSLSFYRKS